MTVQSSTATAREAIDEARERLAPAAERLTEAAGQVRDQLREQVAPKVADAAAQVRDQVAPAMADKVAGALSLAADRIGSHGTRRPRTGRSLWKPIVLVGAAAVGAVVALRVIRARKSADSWEYDASRFSSDRPNEQEIADPTQAKLAHTVDNAKAAVSEAVDQASDQVGDSAASGSAKVTDLTHRAKNAAQN